MRGRTESLVLNLPPSLEQKLEFFPSSGRSKQHYKTTAALLVAQKETEAAQTALYMMGKR